VCASDSITLVRHACPLPFLLVFHQDVCVVTGASVVVTQQCTPLALVVRTMSASLPDLVTEWSKTAIVPIDLLREAAVPMSPMAEVVAYSQHLPWKIAVRNAVGNLPLGHPLSAWLHVVPPEAYAHLQEVTGSVARANTIALKVHRYIAEVIAPAVSPGFVAPKLLFWDTALPFECTVFYSPVDTSVLYRGLSVGSPKPWLLVHSVVLCRDNLLRVPLECFLAELIAACTNCVPSAVPIEHWRVFRTILIDMLIKSPDKKLPDPRSDRVLGCLLRVL
jgi:hypothetical protein